MSFAESSWHSSWSLNKLASRCVFSTAERHCGHAEASISQRKTLRFSAHSRRCKRHWDTGKVLLCWQYSAHLIDLLIWSRDKSSAGKTWGSCMCVVFFALFAFIIFFFLLHVSVTYCTVSLLLSVYLPCLFCFRCNGGWQETHQRGKPWGLWARDYIARCIPGIVWHKSKTGLPLGFKNTNSHQSTQGHKQPWCFFLFSSKNIRQWLQVGTSCKKLQQC